MDWRKFPSWLNANTNNPSTIQALIGDFLRDRCSESLMQDSFADFKDQCKGKTWGESPYEKVVANNDSLDWLISNPGSYTNAACIIEPASNVGQNLAKENIRASSNIAYLNRLIADCDSILFPIWETGKLDEAKMAHILDTCLAVFVEGGYPSARDAKSFNENISLEELQATVENLITSRSSKSAPHIFICIGHQLAAQAHINLIRKATQSIKTQLAKVLDTSDYKYDLLISCCENIKEVGEALKVIKEGKAVAEGWADNSFAVAENEEPEIGHCELHHYEHDGEHPCQEFKFLLAKHVETSEAYDGIVEQSISYEKNLNIVMFHSDEVNEEAILFANWAYNELHSALRTCRHAIALSELGWVLNLPKSIEILCSTYVEGKKCTEVAATCINYVDYETNEVRRSFSFQFHPELLSDLREFHLSGEPSYEKLKSDDGVRMLMRVLYESIID